MEVGDPSNTVRVEILLSSTVPQEGEAQHIIGYWPEHLRDEIKTRGYYPCVRIMWPEDLEVFASGRGAQIAARVANDNLSADPLIEAIANKMAEAAPQRGQVIAPPFLMKIEDYANRCGYSVAFIKRLIPKGLPTLGIHKARRVHVVRADKWMEENLDRLDVTDSGDVADLAVANAHKSKKETK